MRADAGLRAAAVDFVVAPDVERSAVEVGSTEAVAERFMVEAASTVVVVDTVAVADMAADTGKFARGLI